MFYGDEFHLEICFCVNIIFVVQTSVYFLVVIL